MNALLSIYIDIILTSILFLYIGLIDDSLNRMFIQTKTDF